MYWMITAYDHLDMIQLRVRCVDDTDSGALTTVYQRGALVPLEGMDGGYPDVLAYIATEVLNIAFDSGGLGKA